MASREGDKTELRVFKVFFLRPVFAPTADRIFPCDG